MKPPSDPDLLPLYQARREVHRGRIIDVHVETVTLPNGQTRDFDIVHHPGAAAVVAVDAASQVYMVRQPRYASAHYMLEIPAGTLNADEPPQVCARRELEEETGMRAQSLQSLGAIWTSPGFCSERIWLYLATDLQPSVQKLDEDEILTVHVMALQQAVAEARDGTLSDAKSICALLRAAARLGL